ncbi:MAG: GntR family transcriptional regulator [Propionibacteriaceae bacterium]|nr:GntR family transcriptional regulator [Propionibacteriaceae bacterium]
MIKNPGTADNAADGAHARLRDAILSGSLRPNLRLVETDLAAELGVSRTPVREALLRLRQEGLVAQDRGWVVKDHDPAEVLEYFEARAAIESAAAGLAAQRIGEDALAALRSLVEQMEDAQLSRREINALNSRFHTTITAASGNSVLTGFARSTEINYWTFATPVVFTEADDRRVNSEHRSLLAALEAGDPVQASQIAHAHVTATTAIIARSLGISRI